MRSATARDEREWLILEIISYSRKLYEALIDGRSSHAVRAFAILNAVISQQSILKPGQQLTVHGDRDNIIVFNLLQIQEVFQQLLQRGERRALLYGVRIRSR